MATVSDRLIIVPDGPQKGAYFEHVTQNVAYAIKTFYKHLEENTMMLLCLPLSPGSTIRVRRDTPNVVVAHERGSAQNDKPERDRLRPAPARLKERPEKWRCEQER